jgi:hypothetical protein
LDGATAPFFPKAEAGMNVGKPSAVVVAEHFWRNWRREKGAETFMALNINVLAKGLLRARAKVSRDTQSLNSF